MSEKAKIRIGRLDTVGGVVRELGRVYRKARRGELDVADATRLATILRELRCCLEAGGLRNFEKRLRALETAAHVEPPKPDGLPTSPQVQQHQSGDKIYLEQAA